MAQPPDRILDGLLAIGYQRGDSKSSEQLVAHWHDRLKWHLTGNSDASSEIVQNVWVELYFMLQIDKHSLRWKIKQLQLQIAAGSRVVEAK